MGDNYKDKEGAILTLEVNWYSYVYKISLFPPVVLVVVNVEGGTQNKSNVIGGSHNIDENWPGRIIKFTTRELLANIKSQKGVPIQTNRSQSLTSYNKKQMKTNKRHRVVFYLIPRN